MPIVTADLSQQRLSPNRCHTVIVVNTDCRLSKNNNPMIVVGFQTLDSGTRIDGYFVIRERADDMLQDFLAVCGFFEEASALCSADSFDDLPDFDLNRLLGKIVRIAVGYDGFILAYHKENQNET